MKLLDCTLDVVVLLETHEFYDEDEIMFDI